MKPETSTALSLIVSLHDVAPATFERSRRQMEELRELGVARMSLLVVPYYHRQQRIGEDSRLCDWLRGCQSEGHEIILHGFSHQLDQANISSIGQAAVPVRSGGGPRNWFLENIYTNREAEFLNSDYTTARSRMEAGLGLLQKEGLRVSGFIAPAWLMNPDVEQAACDLGLLYSNTLTELVHLPSGGRHPTRSCVWSTRAAWRRICSRAWNAMLFRRLADTDPFRISIHPSDLDHPAIWAQIRDLVQAALAQRQATTYVDWVSLRSD